MKISIFVMAMTETLFPKYSKGEKKMKMWQVRYFDSYGDKVAVLIWAKTKQNLLNKFRRDFGYYDIIDIKEIGK